MENLRNFVVIEFQDGIEIVNKHWRINETSFYFPSGVKDRLEYFKLINTMVSPGYQNEKYTWSPRSVVKVYSSDEEFEEAVIKLEMTRLRIDSGDDDSDEMDGSCGPPGRDENALQFAMSSSRTGSGASTEFEGKYAAGPPHGFPVCPPLPPFTGFAEPGTDNRGPRGFDFSAGGHPSDDGAGRVNAHYAPTTGATDSNTSSENAISTSPYGFSSKMSEDSKTRGVDTPMDDNQLHHILEYITIDINSKLTKLLANQEQIIDLINKQLKSKSCDTKRSLSVSLFTDELEDYFVSKFPLKSMADVNESENMLFRQPYYKFLKSKLLSFIGSNNLYFATKIILTKLLTNRVATRITFIGASVSKKCDKRISSKDTEYTVQLENLMLYTLILDVLMTSFDCDEEQINVPIRSWFEHAKDRHDRKEYLKSKSKTSYP